MKFTKAKNIHFIGIGGIGMSSIAQIIHAKGAKISGSDNSPSEITEHLSSLGKISQGHTSENVTQEHELVVYSPAIPQENVELKKAKELNIKTISYAEALGELTEEYFTIAIAGTHGKSTTTAMTALLIESLDPTVVLGTKFDHFKNNNFRVGESKYLLIEACEYKETFLTVHPNIIVLTNIEADHLDHFKTEENYVDAYKKLLQKLPEDGTVIINSADKFSNEITKDLNQKTVKVDFNNNLKPGVPGEFNIQNASMAAKTAETLGIDNETITEKIKQFKGTWRRFERKGKIFNTASFIDDYGHHPTEIKATLKAIKTQHPNAKVLCIYQPHQHSRTHYFLNDFAKAFKDADEVIVPDIYKVRDTKEDVENTSTDDLVNAIKQHHKNAHNGEGLLKTAQFIKENHSKYDIIITMGAGDITEIYKSL